ncbi:hypothetical protein [Pseudoalteromonas rubra]|uniref:hypothetical protein n=1 Tax=Pseudoalteromonas rubra TaxID=43658 RepID=UPI002DBC969B|nr:hypothetical protein [Pseudoalteromonas rubra]MEC4088754.1 hypothetical protein [Pseudoalteromonas rubra]
MSYLCREGNQEDVACLIAFWKSYTAEYTEKRPDLQMKVKNGFDFETFVYNQLCLDFTYMLVVELDKKIVGAMILTAQDDTTPIEIPGQIAVEYEHLQPFEAQRTLNAHAIYFLPEHRNSQAVQAMFSGAESLADKIKANELTVSVDTQESGLIKKLEREGFNSSYVVYRKRRFELDAQHTPDFPSLLGERFRLQDVLDRIKPKPIVLRNLNTNEVIKDKSGNPVCLTPLLDDNQQPVVTSVGMYVYPNPIVDPKTRDFAVDNQGNLLFSPPLKTQQGKIFEHQGLPVYKVPVLHYVPGDKYLSLKKDSEGNCVFHQPETDDSDNILVDSDGHPVYKPTNNEVPHV